MAIKRYTADRDNTITNAYKSNLTTRGVSGNMGESDILEVFHIYGQASSASSENSRILVRFPTDTIAADRTAGTIPASGSVSFYLRMFNARHSQPTPANFILTASAITTDWQEGVGLDMENYSDIDASNWITASDGPIVKWTTEGGDYDFTTSASFQQTFETGFEDLEIDISPLMEQWISSSANDKTARDMGSKNNYGVGIFLTSSQEDATVSYYTKMFFARGSSHFFKRPIIEARWDDSKSDDRGNFFLSSSLVPAADNLMKLYLYNIVKGQLTNIPAVGTGDVLVSIYSGSSTDLPTGSKLFLPVGGGVASTGDINITASFSETGIYTASFAYASSSITTIFDVWHSGGIEYHTGSAITVKTFAAQSYNFDTNYVTNVTNLRDTYSNQETARFRLYTRKKNWSPNIYVKASEATPNHTIENAYYRITRASDGFKVVEYGTGSLNQTKLSYDNSGSYFDFDMAMLEKDQTYDLNFVYKINGTFVQQPETFKFRVE